jgi:hypothetical protein
MLQVIECVEAINNGDESGTRIKLQGISLAGQPSRKRLEGYDFSSWLVICAARKSCNA